MIKAVIFDLDGVLVTTDELHFAAWKALADKLNIKDFTKEDNVRQRGVSRMASLEVVLEKTDRAFSEEEKLTLAEEKNEIYVRSLSSLSEADVLSGANEFIDYLKSKGIKTAVGSASKNTPLILEKTKLANKFDAVISEVFLIAAKKLGVAPCDCVVVEDSDAGIEAAKTGGMYAIAVGAAEYNPKADVAIKDLESLYRALTIFA